MTLKTFHIHTFGCQMNDLDSQRIHALLEKKGLNQTEKAEEADLILFNTCSVRELAEQKVINKLRALIPKKKKSIIGVIGCMAAAKKKEIFKNFPVVDFIIGPNHLGYIDKIINQIDSISTPSFIDPLPEKMLDPFVIKRNSPIKASVAISRGCNNFCSYCIVPYTRGRMISRPFEEILEECRHLIQKGYKEIMLLGQNVNSYGKDLEKPSITFADLLYTLDKIEGLERLRFLTSHPKDITKELIYAVRDLASVCECIHFPIQSGSNHILKKMNRNYTREEYLEKIQMMKESIPQVTFGTDILVGFPSEKEEDFYQTYDIIEQVRFSKAFIFAFSPRPYTPAFQMKNDVPQEEKKQRVRTLLDRYKKIFQEDKKKLIGQIKEVLVERKNRDQKHLKGHTRTGEKVIFLGNEEWIGTIKNIRFDALHHETFIGTSI